MLNFEKLRTPAGDGEVLIEPPPDQWAGLIEENRRKQKRQEFALLGTSVAEVREAVRALVLGGDGSKPVIALGHQPAFIHPGVWAKYVAVHQAAARAGLRGLDFVVDSDAPASPALKVPAVGSDGFLSLRQIDFYHGPAGCAHEGRPVLPPPAVDAFRRQLASALGHRFESSMMPEHVRGVAEAAAPRDAVDQHLGGRNRIDVPLGANLQQVRISRVFVGRFVADLLLNAGDFAVVYNASLGEYRRRQRVRAAQRPLPDLGVAGQRVETALWIYQPLHQRRRLWVERRDERVHFYADETLVGAASVRDLTDDADRALKTLAPWLVRPRALTLTLWARLLACDLFVHGIGGAKYDRITDDIFRRYYRCEPPKVACVTATLRLPLPRYAVTDRDLAAARRGLRDLNYNPQRHIRQAPSAAALLADRERLIGESKHLREADAPGDRRREVFRAIRATNSRIVHADPLARTRLSERLSRLNRQSESNQIADSREFFYALQPRERLEMLARKITGSF